MIEQALYGSQDAGGYRFLARSPGFGDDWLAAAERLCTGFGERPAGVACPGCLFARPFDSRHVAVVQVADQGPDDAGRPGALGFRLLILPQVLYAQLGGDPFYIADQLPPDWQARGSLPVLEWNTPPPPPPTIAALRAVLDVPYSATLLGGVQALLDGKRLAFERTAPDMTLLPKLWTLLPTNRRAGLWPATFAFGNSLGFDAVVMPRAGDPLFEGCLTEEQAGDYPEGRYELSLQKAVESDAQGEINALLTGYSLPQMSRLTRILFGLGMLAFFLILPTVIMAILWLAPPAPTTAPPPTAPPKAEAEIKLRLPPAEQCPPLEDNERRDLAERLRTFARARNVDTPAGATDAALTDAIERIDRALDAPDRRRDPGPLRDLGPVQRRLRALLWKHDVAGYDAPGLNTIELVEKLEEKVGPPEERPRH